MNNIMVVDDEEHIVELMSDMLNGWGYHTITARDGEEALEKFQKTPIDLVITDLKLPKMNGVALLDKFKDLNHKTEVILFTGYPEVNSAVDALKKGAFDYLIKPIDLAELKLKIERALEKKNMEKSIRTLQGINWAMIISIPIWLTIGIYIANLLK